MSDTVISLLVVYKARGPFCLTCLTKLTPPFLHTTTRNYIIILYNIEKFILVEIKEGCMANNPTKRDKVTALIDQTFFPSNPDVEPFVEVPLPDVYLHCLRKYGASKGVVDGVLETFVNAGLLQIKNEKVYRVADINEDKLEFPTWNQRMRTTSVRGEEDA